jgi:hypothetical protein
VAVCYLCLDTGADEPLRRDCACRGTDAGFVHLACLTGYAATKSMQVIGMNLGMNELVKPWETCPGCHQYYQNELGVDIATEFVSFVRRQYPHDTQRKVDALYLKLCTLIDMLKRLTAEQKREVGVTANVLLSLIDRMKGDAPRTYRYSQIEAYIYHTHGRIALDEGTEEGARRAVAHFEKDLEVCEAIGDADGVVTAKRFIAVARSKYDDGHNDELLKASRDLYEFRIAEDGEESEYTIISGKNYAVNLHRANHGGEAKILLMKLLATSKQVFGPHHITTKRVESALQRANTHG